jgi:hypothetical protein
MLGAAARQIKAILKKPNDVTPDGLRVCLALKTDERHINDLALAGCGKTRMHPVAMKYPNRFESEHESFVRGCGGRRLNIAFRRDEKPFFRSLLGGPPSPRGRAIAYE